MTIETTKSQIACTCMNGSSQHTDAMTDYPNTNVATMDYTCVCTCVCVCVLCIYVLNCV